MDLAPNPGTYSYAQLFMWFLRVQTQILILQNELSCPLVNPIPQPYASYFSI